MLTKELIKTVGFDSAETDIIFEKHTVYCERLIPFINEYTKKLALEPYVPYTIESGKVANEAAQCYANDCIKAIPEENEHFARLLAWLELLPFLKGKYEELGIGDDIFAYTVNDIYCKVRECRSLYGVLGVFANWFFLFFDIKLFGFGRLQFECKEYLIPEYTFDDYSIKKGERVFTCHIPTSGPVTLSSCLESFDRAYQFFKPLISGSVLPIICASWLLYPPYVEKVFPEGSNTKNFALLFDPVDTTEINSFSDAWRVFNVEDKDITDISSLPCETSMQKAFINYMSSPDATYGYGHGVILWDGENKKIINR